MLRHHIVNKLGAGGVKVRRLFQLVCRLTEGLRHDGVQGGVGVGDGVGGAHHAELELVAREGKGGGAVAVGGILLDDGNRGHTGIQSAGGEQLDGVRVGDNLAHHIVQLIPQKDGDDSGRGLLGTQTVLIAYAGGGLAQQVGMAVHRSHDAGEHQQELHVLIGGVPGVQQVLPGICADGPVVVLTRAVDAGVGLLMEQTDQTVAGRHPLHGLHGQLVLIHR